MNNEENKYKTKIINKKEMEVDSTIYGYRISDLYNNISFEDVQLLLLLRGKKFSKNQKKIYKIINFLLLTNGLEDASVLAASNSVVGGGLITSSLISKIASSSGVINGSKEIELVIKKIENFKDDISANGIIEEFKNINDNSEYTLNVDFIGIRDNDKEENVINFILENTKDCLSEMKYTNLFLKNKNKINKLGYYFSKILILCFLAKDIGLGRNEIMLMININSLYLSSILALEQKESGIQEFPFYLKELKKNINIKTNFNDEDYFL